MLRDFVIIVAGLFLLAGCASFPAQKTAKANKSLTQAAIIKFEDVPVPRGFSLMPNESFSFQNDATRVGLLKYVGRPSAEQVVSFYKERMFQYGWVMLNIVEYGRRMLNFEKDNQSCVITVEPAATKTIIIISLAPKSKGWQELKSGKEDSRSEEAYSK